MAKQLVNVGTVANDDTGDPLRTAFIKINDNADELYADTHTHANKTTLDATEEAFTTTLKNKLDAIEENAKDDLTAAEIKTLYESNANTEAFTTTEQTKLASIDDNADVTSVNETSHADVVVDGDFTLAGLMKTDGAGGYSTITDDSTNWDTAYTHSQSAHAPIDADNTAANETSHADVVVDGDFTTNGYMKRTGAGAYAVQATPIPVADTEAKCTDATADNTAANETSHADVVQDGDFNANGIMERTNTGVYNTIKVTTTTAAPGVNDDNTAGYEIRSRWIDTATDKEYVCTDATTGAAVWVETTGSGGGAGSDTTAIHDDTAGEINAITEKGSPTSGDWLIIEDGADSNNKKKVNVANLPTGGGGEANTYSDGGTGGVGITLTKSGVDLPFKNMIAGSAKLTVTNDAGNSNVEFDFGSVASTDLSDTASILRSSDIGVNVQAYNANNALTTDITYEQLDTNGDVGTGAGQLAIGNHTHTGVYEPADADIAKTDVAESVTALWNFTNSGLGGLTDYDVTVGDVTTPDYGIIRIGDSIIGRTSYNAASLDMDGSFIIRNVGSPATSNIEFAFAESSNSVRFAIPKSGVGNATYNPRSMLLAGPAPADDTMVTVGYWQGQGIFDNLTCDTGTTGADLGVQNDLEVEGDIFTDSIKESTTAAGVTIDGLLIKDSGIPEAAVTAHEAALSITESQVSNLGTAVTLNADTDVSGNSWVLDEDAMGSNDATKVPTQQSVKAYVDTLINKHRDKALVIAVGDETTALTTGTAKVTFRMPFAFTLTGIRASLTTAGSTSGTTTIDLNEGGTSVLSTKLTIDATEKTSTTAATAAVISDSSLADDAEMTIDIDAISGGANEAGLKVYLIGYIT